MHYRQTVRSITFRKFDARGRQGGGGACVTTPTSLQLASLSVSGDTSLNTLSVSGAASMQAVNTTAISSTSVTTDSATISDASITSYLTVGNINGVNGVTSFSNGIYVFGSLQGFGGAIFNRLLPSDPASGVTAEYMTCGGDLNTSTLYVSGDSSVANISAAEVSVTSLDNSGNTTTTGVTRSKVYYTGVYTTNADFTYSPLLGNIISISRGALPYLRTISLPTSTNLDGLQIIIMKNNSNSFTVRVTFSTGTFLDLANTAVTSPYTILGSTQFKATIVVARGVYYLVSQV